MKNIFFKVAGIAAIAATVMSCNKDEVPAPTPTPQNPAGNIASLNAFFSQQGAQMQLFTINNNSQQTVTGAHGTVLTFNANTFVTESGAPVTGNITIQLKEIYSKKEMILSNAGTNAELFPSGPQEPLISGGEFYVNAVQGSTPLKLGPGQTYSVFLPSATTPNPAMGLFQGTTNSNGILWGANADSSSTLYPSTAPGGYFATCDSIHWGNADCFLSSPTYTNISLHLTGTFDPAQLKAYVWYDNSNVVWTFYGTIDQLTNILPDNHTATGVPIHLIVISVKDGLLYTSILSATASGNDVFNMTMTQTGEAAFSTQMESLP